MRALLTLSLLVVLGAWAEVPQETPVAGTLYKQGSEAVKKQDYAKALKLFQEVTDKEPKNADALTMLAFSQRKLGMLDAAFENYRKALEIDPKHAEAREYLGEAHIQAAVREIETLRGYGDAGKEQAEELKKALKDAAAKLDAVAAKAQ